MWVEFEKPDGKRLSINLDTTYAFDEQPDGSVAAVSITGIGVPVAGMTYAQVLQQVQAALAEQS